MAGCDTSDVRVTEGSSFARAAADALQRGSKMIVAAGGDGSVSATASVVAGTDAALGVLPLGTLNHFAKDLAIPLDLAEAAAVLAQGRTVSVDIGDANGRPFINNASVGMYASLVSERVAMQRIGRGKWIAHGLAAIRVWRRYRPLRVEVRASKVEGRSTFEVSPSTFAVRTPFVFIGNNEYQLSGLELGGRKALGGGRLHVCMAPGMSRGDVARLIMQAIFGDVCNLDGFDSFMAAAVTLDAGASRLQASLDGEVVMLDNPLTCRSRPGALRVVVP